MPGVAELLDRLRPVVAPGADASSGVPADRRHEAESELTEVFAVIADVQRDADRLRTAATVRAEQLRQDADHRAAQLVDSARQQAEAVRAEAAAAARVDADRDLTAITDDADAVAAGIRRRAERELPGVVDDVVAAAMTVVGL
ncbi:MAG TPA: hypothetical protein VL652_17280 [Kutzneria sp.]|jgi:vacuolar-type H+-ATPase subunit H|nr:hypothetical protein [Kutzneria sp.]